MIEQNEITMANRYFKRRMMKIFVDSVCKKGIESFETYLSYRYRDSCYYYSGYAILGLNDDDYLMRGEISIPEDFIWGNGGYSHGWVEFKYKGMEYVFDSMCRNVVPKDEWYKSFKPKITFKYSKKEIIESFKDKAFVIQNGYYEIRQSKISEYYTKNVYNRGKLFMCGDKVKKFIAYDEPCG